MCVYHRRLDGSINSDHYGKRVGVITEEAGNPAVFAISTDSALPPEARKIPTGLSHESQENIRIGYADYRRQWPNNDGEKGQTTETRRSAAERKLSRDDASTVQPGIRQRGARHFVPRNGRLVRARAPARRGG
jgi:hypothetical protein